MHKLDIFQRYLKGQDIPTNASQITTTHLRQFLVHLQTALKPRSNLAVDHRAVRLPHLHADHRNIAEDSR
ncbi:MAG: hypothetical protein V3T92_06145 [Anaerolineae bacterium]